MTQHVGTLDSQTSGECLVPYNPHQAMTDMWATFDSLRERGVCKAAPVVQTPVSPGTPPRRNNIS